MNGSTTESGLITSQQLRGEPVRTCEPAILADAAAPVPEQDKSSTQGLTIVRGED